MTPRDYFLKVFVEPYTPLKREQTPEDMSRAVVFLVSEDAKNITGQAFSVDGGSLIELTMKYMEYKEEGKKYYADKERKANRYV